MTTINGAKDTLLKQFLSNFDNTIPVNFMNKDDFYFTTGTATTKPSDSSWVRFYIKNNNSFQNTFASTGNRNFRRQGLIIAQIFVPANSGTKTGEEIGDEINNIFEGKRFTDIYCYAGTFRESDIQEDGFFMFVLSIPFDFDTRK